MNNSMKLLWLLPLVVFGWFLKSPLADKYLEGDGVFVWSCYIITALVMIGNLIAVRAKHRALCAEITLKNSRHSGKATGEEHESA